MMSARDYSPELGLRDDDFAVENSDVEDENVEENGEEVEEEEEAPAKKPKLSADRKIAATSLEANQDQAPPSARTRAASTRPSKQQTAPRRRKARTGRSTNMQSAPQPRARLIDWTHHGTVKRASSLPPVRSMEEGSTGKKYGRRSVSVTRAEVTDERLCFIREYMALKAITKQDMEEFDNGGYMPPHRKISNHPYVVGAAEAMKEFKKTGKNAEIIAFNNILSMMSRLRVASEEQIAVKSKKEDLEKELNQLKAEEKKKEDEIEAAWQQY